MDINSRLVVKQAISRRRQVVAVAPPSLRKASGIIPLPGMRVQNVARIIKTARDNNASRSIDDRLAVQQRLATLPQPANGVGNGANGVGVVTRMRGRGGDRNKQPERIIEKAAGKVASGKVTRKPIKYITADNSDLDRERIANIKGYGAGRILVILGNGPSLSEIEVGRLKNQHLVDLMSINRPDERAWPTRYWAFFDPSQSIRHKELWEAYDGLLFNSTSIKQRKPNTIQLKNLGSHGFSRNLITGFNIGQSSVYAAMQIALWMGYEHTYILGIDMCEIGGKTHYYGINPDAAPDVRRARFPAEAAYYSEAADILTEQERKKYTFCSRDNPYEFVDRFNRIDQDICVYDIIDHARRLDAIATVKATL